MRLCLCVVGLVLLTLAGCAPGLDRSHKFDAKSDKALLLLTVTKLPGLTSYRIYAKPYDPVTKKIDELKDFAKLEDNFDGRYVTNNQHSIVELTPGPYLIYVTGTQHGFGALDLDVPIRRCIKSQAFQVELQPGKIVYAGSFYPSFRHMLFTGHDMEEAKAFLAEYRDISAEVLTVTPEETTFERCPD